MTDCQNGIDKKAAAAQAKQLLAQEKAAEKAAKQAAQLAKQQARAAQQAAKQIAAMQKANQTRQKAMVAAAEEWVKGCGGTVAGAMDEITSAVTWVRQNTELTYDEAIAAVTVAAESHGKLKECDWQTVYQDVARGWHDAQQLSPGPLDPIDGDTVPVGGGPVPSPAPPPGPVPSL
jgi:hypothetical protein